MTSNLAALRAVASVMAAVIAVSCGPTPDRSGDEPTSMLSEGPPSDLFTARLIGTPLGENERPRIANVEIVDLDEDGLPDILVCDAAKNLVSWIRQFPPGEYHESVLEKNILAPSRVEAIDFDRDGDLDLVVASLGELFPDNRRIGAVVVLENNGREVFTTRIAAQAIARAADAQAGDLDGDGDLDIAVAAFGYDQGETLWLENAGGWSFTPHQLQPLSGAINTIVIDINGDGALDIVSLVSQEWEEIWAFVNDGHGRFTPTLVWGSTNADFGSSWITIADLDRDGDRDIIYSNGDAFDYAPANSRPWHGVQWLENQGGVRFALHRIADLSGASSPQAADIDGDGDVDVVAVSAYNRWDDPKAQSLVWLENNGMQRFTMHAIARSPTHLITLAIADLDKNGTADLVTGGMHISGPYDRISRVTLWSNRGSVQSR